MFSYSKSMETIDPWGMAKYDIIIIIMTLFKEEAQLDKSNLP